MASLRQCLHDVSLYLLFLIAITTLGPLQFGFHLAELNAPEDVITCKKKAINPSALAHVTKWFTASSKPVAPSWLPECIEMTKAEFATVSSIFTIGGLAGALYAGPFTSKRGRLPAMRLTALFYIVGAVVETLSGSITVMAIGRLLTGVGAGASTVIVPLFISEVAPPRERGLFGAMTQVSINVGILGTQTLGYFWSYGSAWRWILVVGIAIALAHGLGLLLVPESPAWLAANGDVTKAKRTLQRIRGKSVDIKDEVDGWGGAGDDDAAEEEGLLAQATDGAPLTPVASRPPQAHLGFIQVVRDPLYRPAIVAVVGIMFAQQICGINSIIMYSVSLLNGLLPISSALITILISVVNLFTTLACSPLPDRLGRKTCLLLSIVGQGTSSFALALSIVLQLKIMSALSVLAFVGFFAVGLGPVPFILASELVGVEAVGATQSWCLAANYTATFLVAQFFPIVNVALNQWLGGAGWVYFIFAGFALLSACFVLWKVPETKGKKDADEVWGRTRRID